MQASKEMQEYFSSIKKEVDLSYRIADSARKKGFDPEDKVDIPLAENMAERVEGLISVVAPQLIGKGMAKRIHELESELSPLDWRVGFRIAEEVAKEKFCKFQDLREAMEIGIRVGFAYLTGGIVSAPLEGFIELKIKKRKDGKEYFAVCYAGPIRGAGGTAAATSVILSDYVRTKMGYSPYDPTEEEVNRYVTEIRDYHERAVNLQYFPSVEEIRFLASHLPVEVSGDPTETIEVSNYKDLPRVETNIIRGGVCLVMAEGLAQKAQKLWKRVGKWGAEFGLEWQFIEEFLKLQKQKKAGSGADSSKAKKLSPNLTYISDLVAGRPVLTHPLAFGGFRLRYGRSRTTGFSAAGIHPATMRVLNNYIATGTQLKVERPGKAAAITPCDTIDGPIVKLLDGSVVHLKSESMAKEVKNDVVEILFLGDIMFNYGDFSENGHMLVPAGYCEEWWVQELEKATVNMFGNLDIDKLSELTTIDPAVFERVISSPVSHEISGDDALKITQKLSIPLHPAYTYFWSGIKKEDLTLLLAWFAKANVKKEEDAVTKIIFPLEPVPKRVMELIGLPHKVVNNEFVVVEKCHASTFLAQLPTEISPDIFNEKPGVLEIIQSKIKLRDKAGTFIGARMGRPEKAKMRKLTGSPQVLFPVGEEGGRLRSFQSAFEIGKVRSNFPIYRCGKCEKETIYKVCDSCGKRTTRFYYCKVCGGIETEACPQHGPAMSYNVRDIDIAYYFNKAMEIVGDSTYPDLIKGVRGTSNKDHTPEHLAKGIIRAKHDIYVNKDGTTRFDMSELPITHFKPSEIGTSIEKLKQLGYTKDTRGRPLENPDQVLEIRPQDVILPSCTDALDEQADKVIIKIGNFIDELLVKLYGLEQFYHFTSRDDVIGHLVIGLAPHISAGMIGRIIGFSQTQGCYAHPMWHAALRRDCDGDECCIIMLMDALLNFSRKFLPDKRGGRTMDSPLVLTSCLIPSEVDDQAHGLDTVWKYPLEFYETAQNFGNPWDVEVEQIKKRLNTDRQYEQMGYTHPVSSINIGVKCSAYKSLPSMEEKLKGQMEIAERIRAVNESDVARLVVEKHFLKDTKGNLRKFSSQQFRCVKCNEKFRRPPLMGKCSVCGGKIIFTISEGSVVKYLEPSISLTNKYNVSPYLRQSLELLKRNIEDVFGKDKETQIGLGKWFG